jgi:hypothetical protein
VTCIATFGAGPSLWSGLLTMEQPSSLSSRRLPRLAMPAQTFLRGPTNSSLRPRLLWHRVAEGQCGELFSSAVQKWIAGDHGRPQSQLDQSCEGVINFAVVTHT